MAFDAYIKIDNIPGEALDNDHKDWIEMLSYQFGMTQDISTTASSAGGAAAGRAHLGDLQVTKHIDRASPKLFESAASGFIFRKSSFM